jgi:hypothetical protein
MDSATVIGANLASTRWYSASASDIKYSRRLLAGRCYSVGGIADFYGDAQFRRDVLDQDYIDTKARSWSRPWWNPKRFLLLWPWALIDYGRSILRVLILAVVAIALFGFIYIYLSSSGQLTYTQNVGIENSFRPFYAAAIAFSTLGFTDIVVAHSLAGQLLLMANVLLGYLTLGLLLAILANKVAQRA